MFEKWVRENDYCRKGTVSFTCRLEPEIPFIRSISIICDLPHDATSILLYPSPVFLNEVHSVCTSLSLLSRPNSFMFELNESSLNKIKLLFKHFNEKSREEHKPEQFPEEALTQELQNILNYINSYQDVGHLIPEQSATDTNNANRKSLELISFLETVPDLINSKNNIRQIRELFAAGANPNEFDSEGKSAFYLISEMLCDERIPKLFCRYGNPRLLIANPEFDPGFPKFMVHLHNALEWALYRNPTNAMLFLSQYISPRMSLAPRALSELRKPKQLRIGKIIWTQIDLPNKQTVVTYLKPFSLLTPDEKTKLFQLIDKHFFGPNGQKESIKTVFKEDFENNTNCENEFIEFVFNINNSTGINTVIGFNYFTADLEKNSENPQDMMICELSILENSHRQNGLGFILAARPGHGLQCFNDLVDLTYSANYNSYRLAEDLRYFSPKIKPAHDEKQSSFSKFIKKRYDGFLYCNDKTMTSFITGERYQAKGSKTPDTPSGDFFEGEIKGYTDFPRGTLPEIRSAVIIIPLRDEFIKKMIAMGMHLGIDYISFICEFAVHFGELIPELKDKKPNFKLFQNYPRSKAWLFPEEPATVNLCNPEQPSSGYRVSRTSRTSRL